MICDRCGMPGRKILPLVRWRDGQVSQPGVWAVNSCPACEHPLERWLESHGVVVDLGNR